MLVLPKGRDGLVPDTVNLTYRAANVGGRIDTERHRGRAPQNRDRFHFVESDRREAITVSSSERQKQTRSLSSREK